MYLTVPSLLNRMGAKELQSIAKFKTGKDTNIEILTAVCNGSDTSSFIADLVANAIATKDVVELSISNITKTMNGYLAKVRTLPLEQAVVDESPLENIAYDLVRYDLMQRPDNQTKDNKDDAMRQLHDIGRGAIVLGKDDPTPTSGVSIRVGRSTSQFNFGAFGR